MSKLAVSRRAILKATAGAVGALGGLAAPPVLAQQNIVCRMAHSEAIGSPLTLAFEKWAKTVTDKSGGRIDAQHFPAGQLGNYTQLIEGSRLGTIQVTCGGPDTEEAVAPEIAAAGGAPGFIYVDEAHVDRVLQGPVGQEVSKIARAKTGVDFIDYGEVGFRHLLSKRPVEQLSELKGLKIRVPELRIWVDFWKKLGANPTPLAYAEQYNALSTGVIDGLEADVFSIKGFKWAEQAQQLTITNHWFLPKAIRVNARWIDALPADLRKVLLDSAKEVFAEQRKENRANANSTLEELKKGGLIVHQAKDLPKWREATESQFDEWSAKSPAAKEMVAKIRGLAKA
jgi:TRAP-type transport system periplasmic protein